MGVSGSRSRDADWLLFATSPSALRRASRSTLILSRSSGRFKGVLGYSMRCSRFQQRLPRGATLAQSSTGCLSQGNHGQRSPMSVASSLDHRPVGSGSPARTDRGGYRVERRPPAQVWKNKPDDIGGAEMARYGKKAQSK